MESIAREIGIAVKKAAASSSSSSSHGWYWYGRHMAAASGAIAQRIPLVDFLLEVRDARIPFSSEFRLSETYPPPPFSGPRRIIVLNKMDLANPVQLKEWIRHFEQQNCVAVGVNSHNKVNVKQFLNFLQAQVRELKKIDQSSSATTIMMVGIPNVGKSALANSLHQIGRISAAEKGKLKHAIVTPRPGETKDISSLKIASHPNIYVLDTPGVLPPKILDILVCSKLVLTGAMNDCLVGEEKLARYFLAILSSSDEYKKWVRLYTYGNSQYFMDQKTEHSSGSECTIKQKRQNFTDHSQDFMVHDVRRALSLAISSFDGNLKNEKDLEKLIEMQFTVLKEAFRLRADNDAQNKVCAKLLNLYRTGRLGHYTLDLPALQYEFLGCVQDRQILV